MDTLKCIRLPRVHTNLRTAVLLFAWLCSLTVFAEVARTAQDPHLTLRQHLLESGDSYVFPKTSRFSSFRIEANIVPKEDSGKFDFVVNFSATNKNPWVSEPSSVKLSLTGDSCSGPLDFSAQTTDKKYHYQHYTLHEAFSPLSEIELELESIGKESGMHVYIAKVNGKEQRIEIKHKIKQVSLAVRGADIKLTGVNLRQGS